MVEHMKQVAEASSDDLSLEERNLLSVAYKNVVGARRASLRIIGSIETKENEKGSSNVGLVRTYKAKVEQELNNICGDILNLLDTSLIKRAVGSSEASVFYLKMKVRPAPPSFPCYSPRVGGGGREGSLMGGRPACRGRRYARGERPY
jgi:14-3-3 protein epsilon